MPSPNALISGSESGALIGEPMKQILLVLADIADFLIDVAFIVILILMFLGLYVWIFIQALLLFDSSIAWIAIALLFCVFTAYGSYGLKQYVFPWVREVRTGDRLTNILTPLRKIFSLIGLFSLAKLLYLALVKQEGNWWDIAWNFVKSV